MSIATRPPSCNTGGTPVDVPTIQAPKARLVDRSSSVAKPLSSLRRAAAKVLKGQAPRTAVQRSEADDNAGTWYPVCACTQSHHRNATSVTALQRASGAKTWAGIMTCGSVWLCATCAQKIEKVRGDEVCRLIETARGRGMIVVMLTHTFSHKITDKCSDSMNGLAEALRKMRQRGGYQRFRKSLGFVGLVRSTEITFGANGWHPHCHELWILDPVVSSIAINDLDQKDIERLIASKVFPQWEAAARAAFGDDRAPSIDRGLDVSLVWSATDYLAKCPDRASQLEASGKKRWGADAEMTKTTAKKGRKSSRTFWDILPIAVGEGPSIDDQKLAGLFPLSVEQAAYLVRDYARGTWRKRRMYWTPGRTTKDGYTEGLRDRFDIGEELTDEQIADGELPLTGEQSSEELEKRDPVVASVEFCLFSLAALGRAYLGDLIDRASGSRSIVDIARDEGWLLEKLVDHPDGYERFSATQPNMSRGRLQ